MAQTSNVYPPQDLEKLDEAKRQKLKEAIMKVLLNDPEVKELIRKKNELLRTKTLDEYRRLIGEK